MDAMMVQETQRDLVIGSRRNGMNEIQIYITDCGPGLNPEISAKIFDPFFTTKAEGIGMGLAISRTIIEAHDGRIWVDSEPSRGTSFHFTIPVSS
jgi:two-component system sensor kinase FixL